MKIPVFGRIRSEFQCLEVKHRNVYKDMVKIPMFGRIRSEFQCLKDKIRIPMFGRIT